MSAIMIWRTQLSSGITTYHIKGLPKAPETPSVLHQYLLDGVQRLTTLYDALFPKSFADAEDEAAVDAEAEEAVFDLESNDFRYVPHDEISESVVPLSILLDSVKLLKFQRGLSSEAAIERCDELASAFRDYKVAVIPIVTDDLEMVTRTFQRVNSQGSVMGEMHMVHALTWSKAFSLLDGLDEYKQKHLAPVGWLDVDDDRVLAVCKVRLDLDIYKTEPDQLSRALRERPALLEEAVKALAAAAQFLPRNLRTAVTPAAALWCASSDSCGCLRRAAGDVTRGDRGRRGLVLDYVALGAVLCNEWNPPSNHYLDDALDGRGWSATMARSADALAARARGPIRFPICQGKDSLPAIGCARTARSGTPTR